MTVAVRAPIIVVGTHRSGTTLLGNAVGCHPEVAYWEEPREVWSWGHHFRPDDALSAEDASAQIEAHIKHEFGSFLESSGKPRFAEKTPSNCLRLGFIRKIFPDAVFLHIFRDGRAVVASTDTVIRSARIPPMQQGMPRLLGTPVWQWPALAGRAWRTLGRRSLGLKMEFWGPQPPGWKDWVRRDPRLLVLAKQWRSTIEPALEFSRSLPPGQWLDIRYEELVHDPGSFADRIEEFARLTPSTVFRQHLLDECRTDRVDAWRAQLRGEELDRLRPVLEPTLTRLGYRW